MNERKLFIFISLSIIIATLLLIYKEQVGNVFITSQKNIILAIRHPVQPANVSPFPDGDLCSTSNATGATSWRVFTVSNLVDNGQTDNYNAIQTTINNAGLAGGGIVKLPAGVFLINNHLTMSNNVTLE